MHFRRAPFFGLISDFGVRGKLLAGLLVDVAGLLLDPGLCVGLELLLSAVSAFQVLLRT